MPIVYVVQEPAPERRRTSGMRPPIDLSDAKRFGTLRFCMEWSEAKDLTPDVIAKRMEDALASYSTQDAVLLIGNPTAMTMAALFAALRAGGVVRILMWDRDNREYKASLVDMRSRLTAYCRTSFTEQA